MRLLKAILDESKPIFQQIADMIIDDIVDGYLKEDEQIPSENELSEFFSINRATVRKGLQLLTDQNLIYKKRGIGMFVIPGAKAKLLKERQKLYIDNYIRPLLMEARRIGIDTEAVIKLIKEEER